MSNEETWQMIKSCDKKNDKTITDAETTKDIKDGKASDIRGIWELYRNDWCGNAQQEYI